MNTKNDQVNHPSHYLSHPSGVECIRIAEGFNYNLGCAIKYIWRCDSKGKAIEDLQKAVTYLNREIDRRIDAENTAKVEIAIASPSKSETEGAVFELVQAKAKAGDPHSQYRFGIALFHGEYSGVKIDRSEMKGLYWIKKSADQGNGLAKSFLTEYDGKPVDEGKPVGTHDERN